MPLFFKKYGKTQTNAKHCSLNPESHHEEFSFQRFIFYLKNLAIQLAQE
jgi:hypothetical protein